MKKLLILTLIISTFLVSAFSPTVYAADKYLTAIDKANPFFETTFKEIEANITEGNKKSINPQMDALPRLEQTSNFMGLGETSYANINGKTVTVDGFYRVKDQASNDPNVGAGLLLYQCIQYKIAHPDENVSIAYSTYRFAPSAAVCVIPESKYYGYMRSLFESDYDEHGFVRISYMLTEAARMGIDVQLVLHLNGYNGKHYNSTGKLVKKTEMVFATYFDAAVKSDCYTKYASGKKVSNFMSYKPVKWDVEDKGSTDMMHVKACAVSNYIDSNGVEQGPAVWLSSANLDGLDYRGVNAQNGSQSGVIVSNHDKLFQVTYNFIKLMGKYDAQEEIYELRDLLMERNTQQVDLIRSGRESEIPSADQIVYLGSESDKIFQLYFTALGGDTNVWDTVYNPFCNHVDKFAQSTDYVEFVWNNANYQSFFISDIIMKKVEDKFHNDKNLNNKLHLKLDNYDLTAWNDMVVGRDLGHKNVQDGTGIHAKDILMSYKDDETRHYVSLLTSCNFHAGALYYQTNSILVIDETAQTGNDFYKTYGEAYSYGAIKRDPAGTTFNQNTRNIISEKPEVMPSTFEATISMPKTFTGNGGVILGQSDKYSPFISYEIGENGVPTVVYQTPDKTTHTCEFTDVDVRTGNPIHLAIVHDSSNGNLYCYINGALKQTLSGVAPKTTYLPAQKYVVGGDFRAANTQYFQGSIVNVATWSDMRTAEEIFTDYTNTTDFSSNIDTTDDKLMFAYDMSDESTMKTDLSANKNNIYTDNLWNDTVEPVTDYAYSIAVVGDTQELSEDMPISLSMVYDWIVSNKDAHKIGYVMGLGDITQKNRDDEWTEAKKHIYKLDGVVPYSLTKGNHDSKAKFNQTFSDGIYAKQIDGFMTEGDYTNTYSLFTLDNTDYLLICLDFGPSDNMLKWASSIIEKYPEHRVIITTHQYMYRDGTTLDASDAYPASKYHGVGETAGERDYNDGDEMWNELVSKHSNIVLVLSGHDAFDSIVYRQDLGINGNTVTQMLINPQDLDHKNDTTGGTGMVALLYFSEDGEVMDVRYYSTVRGQYGTSSSQFKLNLGNIVSGYDIENVVLGNGAFSADLAFDFTYTQTDALAIIALYDINGNMIEVKTTPITVKPGNISVNIPLESQRCASYKFMIWNNFKDVTPLVKSK